MSYRAFGGIGVKKSQLTLGAMNCDVRVTSSRDKATKIIHRSLDAGMRIHGTADSYSHGESETMAGKLLRAHRGHALRVKREIAVKLGDPIRPTLTLTEFSAAFTLSHSTRRRPRPSNTSQYSRTALPQGAHHRGPHR